MTTGKNLTLKLCRAATTISTGQLPNLIGMMHSENISGRLFLRITRNMGIDGFMLFYKKWGFAFPKNSAPYHETRRIEGVSKKDEKIFFLCRRNQKNCSVIRKPDIVVCENRLPN